MKEKFYILYQLDPNDSWEPYVPIMYFKDKEVADKILSDGTIKLQLEVIR